MKRYYLVCCVMLSLGVETWATLPDVPLDRALATGFADPAIMASKHQNEDWVTFAQTRKGQVSFTARGLRFPFLGEKKSGKDPKPTHLGLEPMSPATISKLPYVQKGKTARLNLLKGPERDWIRNLNLYSELVYPEEWPGVDLVFELAQNKLAYRLECEPGADLEKILFSTGSGDLRIEEDGSLTSVSGQAFFRQSAPRAYQILEGRKQFVAVQFVVHENGCFSFETKGVDSSKALVIDPDLDWGSYLGGSGYFNPREDIFDVVIDASGAIYVAGFTSNPGFPVTPGAYSTSYGRVPTEVGFLSKLSPDGSQLLFSTFFGGTGRDMIQTLGFAGDGSIYIAGLNSNGGLPITPGAYSQTSAGGVDVFVAHLSSDGANLLACTYLGGTLNDEVNKLAVDTNDRVLLVGHTNSTNFPMTVGAFDTSYGGFSEGFVTLMSANLGGLVCSSYLGGSSDDQIHDCAFDASGNIIMCGITGSASFPTTLSAYDTVMNGVSDGFLVKMPPSGESLIFSTFLGGSSGDSIHAMDIDGSGNIYVSGMTGDGGFPVTSGVAFPGYAGSGDAFIAKFNSSGTSLLAATFFGGNGQDQAEGLCVDSNGAHVTGWTESTNLPTTMTALDTSANGFKDTFLASFSTDLSTLNYGSYIGGSYYEESRCVDSNPDGDLIIAGFTASKDFPSTPGAFDPTPNDQDAFVMRFVQGTFSLAFSTFLGGGLGDEKINDLAVDSTGNIWCTGSTSSTNFPLTPGTLDDDLNQDGDAFLSCFDASGSQLLYSTFLGGSGLDSSAAIALDAQGNVYLAGSTLSSDFPMTDPGDTYGGHADIFVVKLPPSGDSLTYSLLVGGAGIESASAIAVDGTGRVTVAGVNQQGGFPTTTFAFQSDSFWYEDGVVFRLSPNGQTLEFSTYLGTNSSDVISDLALDSAGRAVVTGYTWSSAFPITVGAADTSFNGIRDGFISKLAYNGRSLVFSSFLGGADEDLLTGLVLDDSDRIYVTGETKSADFPVTPGVLDSTLGGNWDMVLAVLSADGSQINASSYLGGSDYDQSGGLALDPSGRLLIVGSAGSGFPVTLNAGDPTFNGSMDGVVVRLDSGLTTLDYASYLGGSYTDVLTRVVSDAMGNMIVCGWTKSSDIPTPWGVFPTRDSLQDYPSGQNFDGYVGRVCFSNPFDPGPISGPSQVCANTVATYSTTPAMGASRYVWSFPAGWSLVTSEYASEVDVLVGTDSGSITVLGQNACGDSNEQMMPVTVNAAVPGAPGTIAGLSSPCLQSSEVSYSIDPVAGAKSYDWSVPGDATILSGSGTNSILVNFGTQDGVVSVRAVNDCGNGPLGSLDITLDAPVAAPTGFSGSTSVCEQTQHAYQVNPVSGALSYVWTGPQGSYVASGQGSTNADIMFGSESGDVSVAAQMACGLGQPATWFVTVTPIPGQPGAISGPTTMCDGATGTYSVTPVPGASDYYWGVPSGSFVTGGGTSSSVTIQFGANSGDVTVQAANSCDTGPMQTLHVDSATGVPTLLAVYGDTEACAGASQVGYAVALGSGASSFTWTVPVDAVIVSGQGTDTIYVDFGGTSGNVSCEGSNGCGTDNVAQLVQINPKPAKPDPISGPIEVCADQKGVAFSITPIPDAWNYSWQVPLGATIAQGQGSSSIIVDFSTETGSVLVQAENNCGLGLPQSKEVIVAAIPEQPAPVNGPNEVCPGEAHTFFVDSVAGANGYLWSVPVDASVTSGQGSESVLVTFGNSSGSVSVAAQNNCGTSSAGSLSVTVLEPAEVVLQPITWESCPGTPASFNVVATGTEPISYQWVKDGQPVVDGSGIQGAQSPLLTLDALIETDAGFYHCEVTNSCGSMQSGQAELIVDGPLTAWIIPMWRVQGLSPVSFEAGALCSVGALDLQWLVDPTTTFVDLGTEIRFDVPALDLVTRVEAQFTDSSLREVSSAVGIYLVADSSMYFDLNGDGCNDLQDLWELAVSWRTGWSPDPNGDGLIDIRDFLFINTEDTLNCP